MNLITAALDNVAEKLQKKGLSKEAEEIDVISNTIEATETETDDSHAIDEAFNATKKSFLNLEKTMKQIEEAFGKDSLESLGKLQPIFKNQAAELAQQLATFNRKPFI